MARVVVGSGPCAVRAAACLPDAVLVGDAGLVRPDVPVDRGVVEDTGANARVVARRYGSAPKRAALGGAIWAQGRRWDLPFQRRSLPAILSGDQALRALGDWTRTRADLKARMLVGGGFEERSYRDWVVRRYGRAVYELLHAPYATKRWGPPEEAGVSFAHLHHGLVLDQVGAVGLGASPEQGWSALTDRVTSAAKELDGIDLDDGRVVCVQTDQGAVDCADGLFWSGSIPELAEWLDDALDEGLQWDARTLTQRHRVEVIQPVRGAQELPDELHMVDAAPFFRVTRPSAVPGARGLDDVVVLHVSLSDDSPLWNGGDARILEACASALAGLAEPSGEGTIRRLPDHDPVWSLGPWHPTQIRLARALAAMNIHLVGRTGTFRHLDPAQELLVAEALGRQPDAWHEHTRAYGDPPVRLQDQAISLTRFIER